MLCKISWLCLFIAVVLFVCSVFSLAWSSDNRRDGDALVIENSEQDLGEQRLGSHTLELYVRNTSHQPRRILGVTGH